MKARLVKDRGDVKLLCKNGSFSNGSIPLLADLILNFKKVDLFNGVDGTWSDTVADMAFYPGETLAIVTDNSELVIYNSEAFSACFESSLRIGAYVSSEEYAKMHNKTQEVVKVYCREGRIAGAQKVGRAWMIPKDAPYPVPPQRQRPKSCGPRSKGKSPE